MNVPQSGFEVVVDGISFVKRQAARIIRDKVSNSVLRVMNLVTEKDW
jgi:hypothetical protein